MCSTHLNLLNYRSSSTTCGDRFVRKCSMLVIILQCIEGFRAYYLTDKKCSSYLNSDGYFMTGNIPTAALQ